MGCMSGPHKYDLVNYPGKEILHILSLSHSDVQQMVREGCPQKNLETSKVKLVKLY